MRSAILLALAATVCSVTAKLSPNRFLKRDDHAILNARANQVAATTTVSYGSYSKPSIIPQNKNTTKFKVDGTKVPDVDFDIGESYAGLLPISDKPNVSELFFWFFPSENAKASDEIVIWLNGGPGCSSLEGLLQENGPFLWQSGTYKPVKNPWSWTKLSNVVWVEQPAGTGFSQKKGTPSATNEDEVAAQFLGFWRNFVDVFGLHGRKIYITGESYAGYYVPYIADAMHNKNDTKYYNANSLIIYDPVTSYDNVQEDVVVAPFVDYWSGLFNLNASFTSYLKKQHKACGYEDFLAKTLVFPPKGPLPSPPNSSVPGCGLFEDVFEAVSIVNPCFNIYQVSTLCPLQWDVLGFPGSFDYLPEGAQIYFNRPEVQKAINAPLGSWAECSNGVLDTDTSPPSGLSVLPRVIEKNTRTLIAHGDLDMVLIKNGTIVSIQNMTFHGAQGFSTPPTKWKDFYVPYHAEPGGPQTAGGSGVAGKWNTERGLTFSSIALSGHMVPQYAPTAAFRHLEFILGRIDNLGVVSDFTTQTGNYGNNPR